jgi:hypothetical protein
MPIVGETTSRNKVWRKKYSGGRAIWHACLDCGKQRWVQLTKGKPVSLRCHSCATKGDKNYHWKGGINKHSAGYILIQLKPSDFFYSMAEIKGHYVLEHRLVMAKHLGRNLHSWEIVHHKNHIRDDNRIENLQLISVDKHNQITIMEMRIKKLEMEIQERDLTIKELRIKIENSKLQ